MILILICKDVSWASKIELYHELTDIFVMLTRIYSQKKRCTFMRVPWLAQIIFWSYPNNIFTFYSMVLELVEENIQKISFVWCQKKFVSRLNTKSIFGSWTSSHMPFRKDLFEELGLSRKSLQIVIADGKKWSLEV